MPSVFPICSDVSTKKIPSFLASSLVKCLVLFALLLCVFFFNSYLFLHFFRELERSDTYDAYFQAVTFILIRETHVSFVLGFWCGLYVNSTKRCIG